MLSNRLYYRHNAFFCHTSLQHIKRNQYAEEGAVDLVRGHPKKVIGKDIRYGLMQESDRANLRTRILLVIEAVRCLQKKERISDQL